MEPLRTTLCYLVKGNRVLLGFKKRGFGANRYNGIGGKVKPKEALEAAMVRETVEEIGVKPPEYEYLAELNFDEFYENKTEKVRVDVYVATKWEGEPQESDEMKPEWFEVKNMPYDKMLEGDRYWLPLVLKHEPIKAHISYDGDFNLLDKQIEKLTEQQN